MALKWFSKKKESVPAAEDPGDQDQLPEPQEEASAPPELEQEPEQGTEQVQEESAPPEASKTGFFSRLRNRLAKTRKAFSNRIDNLLIGKEEIDDALLEELEEILITSDIGVQTTLDLVETVRERVRKKELREAGELKQVLQEEICSFLDVSKARPAPTPTARPHVIMVVGVNGVGKTTTIGKLSDRYIKKGQSVLLVGADTFRAAAAEQLEIWGDRVGAEVIRHKGKADPSAVAYDGIQAAVSREADVVIIDTAGRLHTKVNLMEQLKKIRRTVARLLPDAPHEVLLVLDATTGQNAISQARLFHEATDITGIILTKLDGTAKGGIVVGICHSLQVPIQYIGIGEGIEDLQAFDADAFSKALF